MCITITGKDLTPAKTLPWCLVSLLSSHNRLVLPCSSVLAQMILFYTPIFDRATWFQICFLFCSFLFSRHFALFYFTLNFRSILIVILWCNSSYQKQHLCFKFLLSLYPRPMLLCSIFCIWHFYYNQYSIYFQYHNNWLPSLLYSSMRLYPVKFPLPNLAPFSRFRGTKQKSD